MQTNRTGVPGMALCPCAQYHYRIGCFVWQATLRRGPPAGHLLSHLHCAARSAVQVKLGGAGYKPAGGFTGCIVTKDPPAGRKPAGGFIVSYDEGTSRRSPPRGGPAGGLTND